MVDSASVEKVLEALNKKKQGMLPEEIRESTRLTLSILANVLVFLREKKLVECVQTSKGPLYFVSEEFSGKTAPKKLRPNDKKIYKILKEKGPLTRGDLVEETGFARTTTFDALTRLEIEKLIASEPVLQGEVGRPQVYYNVVS